MVHLIRRLVRNSETKVMAVDDSRSARRYVADLLKRYRFEVLEADPRRVKRMRVRLNPPAAGADG